MRRGERPWLVLLPGLALVQVAVGVTVRPSGSGTGVEAALRLALAMACSLTVVLGPGLAARAVLAARGRRFPLAFVTLPGPAILALAGGLAWWGAPRVPPQLTVGVVLTPVIVLLLLLAARRPEVDLGRWGRRALLVVVVVLAVAVGKGTWSPGPDGELYGGTVSRTLEVGGRSDSRISFHVVQLVAHGTSPYSERGGNYFLPYSFSHRGPLAGLAASPVVLLSGVRVPVDMPDQPWSPFDPEGFAVYRLTMSTMAAGSLFVLFALVSRLLGLRVGYQAILIAALTPFLLHETYFTWPKLQAAGLVLVAAYLVVEGRPGWAGLATGFGYLVHPMALLSLPPLVLLWLLVVRGREKPVPVVRSLAGMAAMGAATLACLVAWRVLNGDEFAQQAFWKDNVLQADAQALSGLSSWVAGRASSVLNTLVPLHLVLRDAEHVGVNSITGPSSGVVHFYFQYWTGLPFGFGIVALPVLIVSMVKTARRMPALFIAVVVLPFVLFATFWGGHATGLLREGMHVWVLTVVILVAWARARWPAPSAAWTRGGAVCLALRAPETMLVLVLPAVVDTPGLYAGEFLSTDLLALACMAAGLLWLARESIVHLGVPGEQVDGNGMPHPAPVSVTGSRTPR